MNNSNKTLIEAAVRPFPDNAELKLSAIDFLGGRVTKNVDAAAIIARWDEVDARKHQSIRQIALWALMVFIAMLVLYVDSGEISRLIKWRGWSVESVIWMTPPPDTLQRVAGKLNVSDRLLLFGDLSKKQKSERKKALWRSEPENPSYYADYAAAYISVNSKLPTDFLETARRIDPTNAWFTYLAAAVEAKDAVKKVSRKGKKVGGKMVYETPLTWEILDQTRLDRAMSLLREARNQPRCVDYAVELMRKRLPLLPRRNLLESIESDWYLSAIWVFPSISIRRLAEAIAAKSWSLSEADDAPGFREIYQDGDLFLHRFCSDEAGVLVDEMMLKVCAGCIAESFASAAEKFGPAEDASHWETVSDWFAGSSERRENRKFFVDGEAVEFHKSLSGFFSDTYARVAIQAEHQPPISSAELKPVIVLEHELLSGVACYTSWVLMALCLGLVACYRFWVALLSRQLARRLECLLVPADWGWIIAMGVVLPLVYVMAVNRLTPLGGREFSARGTSMLMPGGHFVGLWILWLILPVPIVRWRLAKRAGGFGFSGPSWMDWLAVACAAAFVPMIGWAAISGIEGSWLDALQYDPAAAQLMPWMFWAAFALAGLSALWVSGMIFFAIFGAAERQPYRATSALVLVRVHVVIMLVLGLSALGFKVTAQYWFEQDKLSKFDASFPGWNSYEFKVAVQMRKELRDVLGYDR